MRTIILLLFATQLTFAQDKFIGIINDSDGYVNIRAEKTSNSKIVGKIEEGYKFYYDKDLSENWWAIETELGGKKGYVHKSRISNYYEDKGACQCEIYDNKTDELPNLNFKIGIKSGVVCGYLLQRNSKYKIKIAEFSITDCSTGTMIEFFGALQTCYVEIQPNKLKITELTRLPFGKDWNWIETPLSKSFIELDSGNNLVHSKSIPVLNYKLESTTIENFLLDIEKRKGKGYYDELETTIGGLLKCALNGNDEAKKILFDFDNYIGFVLDGAYREFYNESIAIYKWIKE